ncbi:MAG TPA: hypothetical protein VN541_16140 [Tepidisphaeraceae bacterium]|nr:hypothetical protein [Tepidisphaeraceae bacterium]
MNKRLLIIAAAGVLAIGTGAFLSFGPSDSSSQQGAVQPVLRHRALASHGVTHARAQEQSVVKPVALGADLMPGSFRILLTRSIFSEGGQPATASAQASHSGMALRGILQQGAAFIAFIEDSTRGDERQVKIGDPLAGGTVTAIDLHGLELACAGRKTRIQVGQTVGPGPLVGMPSLPAVAESPADSGERVATIR